MTTDQIDRFRSADALRAAILEFHNVWRRSIDGMNTAIGIELEADGRKIKELIEKQTKKARSPAEAQLSKEITTAFADYRVAHSDSASMAAIVSSAFPSKRLLT
jgi:hypothetical protein